jgi:stress-induced morphogen
MTRNQANLLVKALQKRFGGKAEFEAVNEHGRYRFAITSKRFNNMTHLQRQDDVWKVVDDVLTREATLDVSMILAFAPADLAAVK